MFRSLMVLQLIVVLSLSGCTKDEAISMIPIYGKIYQHQQEKKAGTAQSSGGPAGVDMTEVIKLAPEERDTQSTIERNGIAVTFRACIRIGRNTVQCTLTVMSKYQDRKLFILFHPQRDNLPGPKLYDNVGNEYLLSALALANKSRNRRGRLDKQATRDVPTPAVFEFSNLSSQATKIARLDIPIAARLSNSQESRRNYVTYTYRNIPLTH